MKAFIVFVLVASVLIQATVSSDVKSDKGRIVGGVASNIRDRPFQVALYVGGYFCGGSIIAPHKVLTAAHCVHGISSLESYVRAGSSLRNSGSVYHVAHISIHPQYKPSISNNYDVAVLTTVTPFVFSSYIRAIPLSSRRPHQNAMSTVSGWGSLSSGSSIVLSLRQVDVPIVNQATCIEQYGSSTITSNMICAGYLNGFKDSCQGDSGGPLTYNGALVGVVSFGNGCAKPGYAGVYASVPDILSWIISQ